MIAVLGDDLAVVSWCCEGRNGSGGNGEIVSSNGNEMVQYGVDSRRMMYYCDCRVIWGTRGFRGDVSDWLDVNGSGRGISRVEGQNLLRKADD